MQALISLPSWERIERNGDVEIGLLRAVCGLPLLVRVIQNSVRREGVTSVLLIHPPEVSGRWLKENIENRLVHRIPIWTHADENPMEATHFIAQQERHSIWLPWNVVAGIAVDSAKTAAMAEQELVRNSGKKSDGIYSRFNRRLCWPSVRWLSHWRISPNAVSFIGLLFCILSALFFSRGHWESYVVGSLLFFLAGLCDEMDGMLARITFKESPFGCWLESFTDYAGYLLVFSGMTAGLYREKGGVWLLLGVLFVFGCVISMIVAVKQRKIATSPDRPQEFLANYYHHLEADSKNWISRRARQVQFLMKKSAIMHHIILFSVLGLLPAFVALGAFCGNLIWILSLYFGNRFFRAKTPVMFKQVQQTN